jgi:hypothetical protein
MKGQPPFVKDFKSELAALKATHILIAAKESGWKNRDIMKLPFFETLFSDEFINRVNSSKDRDFLTEIRLKNIARDLRIIKIDRLDEKWHFAKEFFDGRRKKRNETI